MDNSTEAYVAILGVAGGLLGFLGVVGFFHGLLSLYISTGDYEKKKKSFSIIWTSLTMIIFSVIVSFAGFYLLNPIF